MAVWMRKGVDGGVFKSLSSEWKSSPKYKLRTFDPVLPSTEPSASDLYRFGTFTRSDHASFWYHKHPSYKKSLNAILLTDMGELCKCLQFIVRKHCPQTGHTYSIPLTIQFQILTPKICSFQIFYPCFKRQESGGDQQDQSAITTGVMTLLN
jgi:hypothetical protein